VSVVCVPAADTTGQVVKVTCEQFTDDFSVTLTATAGSEVDCQAAANATADVTVNTRPTVDVQPPAGNTSVCIDGNATAVLDFIVSSPDANATITLAEPAAQFCTAEPSTICE
jgi:hypothetical protein